MKTANTINNAVTVAICTPYLHESVDDLVKKFRKEYGKDAERLIEEQYTKYGYTSDNLAHQESLMAGATLVALKKYSDDDLTRAGQAKDIQMIDVNGYTPDLSILGSTETVERIVRLHKGSGIICARYSIFYGRPSEYTGNTPESAGYALDIPKNMLNVNSLLTHEPTLRALQLRNETAIRTAIDQLNREMHAPILITPYLKKALEVTR